MNAVSVRIAMLAGAALLLAASPTLGFPGKKTNFSGTYLLQQQKGNATSSAKSRLRVAQKDDVIEITRADAGRRTVSRFPLNGELGDYTSPDGVTGKGKARFQDSDLLLDSEVVTSAQPGAPLRTHTRELWHLSPDSRILTIQYDVDRRAGLGETINQSWTETYVRTRR